MGKNSFYDFDEDRDIFSDSKKQRQNETKKQNPTIKNNIDKKSRQQNINSNSRSFPNNNSRASQNIKNKNTKTNKKSQNIPIDKKKLAESQAKVKSKKSPKKTFTKVFFTLLLVILLLFSCGYAYISNIFGGVKFSEKEGNKYINDSELVGKNGVLNILLVGGDARKGDKTFRSDTMMLVSIDTNHDKIKLSSFLRDSYVKIPEHRKNKLNAACSYGGIELVQDTIEYNFKIKIDNYVYVDFEAFEKIIDVLGGVNVPVTKREASYMNKFFAQEGCHVTSGKNVHLNGKHALMFCRIRKLDSDFKRTERQRMVMSALKEKMSECSMTDVVNIVKKISPYIQTDFSKNNLMALSFQAGTKYLKYGIVQRSVPKDDEWYSKNINGQSMVMFKNFDKTVKELHNFIYEE